LIADPPMHSMQRPRSMYSLVVKGWRGVKHRDGERRDDTRDARETLQAVEALIEMRSFLHRKDVESPRVHCSQ